MKKLTTEQFTKETKISRLSGSIDARMALRPKEIAVINSAMKSRSPVVYLLGHPTLERTISVSNPIRNPLLPAKAVDRQPSLHLFGTSL